MWPPPIRWTLTWKIICILFFFTFSSDQIRFPFWDIYRGPWYGPWMQCLVIYTICIFLRIFIIFLPFFSVQTSEFPFLDIYPRPWQQHLTILITISIFFLNFIAICIFSTATPSIYRNIQWTLKTPPNVITNHPYFFWFFPIFTFSTATPSIYGNMQWTLKTPTIPILFWIFPILLLFFTFSTATPSIYGNMQMDPENTTQHHHQPAFFFWFFLFFLAIFRFNIATLSIFGNKHWTLLNIVNIYIPDFFWFFHYF